MWRERKRGRGRRGCLIYWFNSCQCPSLSLSVREGKWSMQPKTPRPNHIFSQLLSLSLVVSLASPSISRSISHSPSFLPLYRIFIPFRHPLADWLPLPTSFSLVKTESLNVAFVRKNLYLWLCICRLTFSSPHTNLLNNTWEMKHPDPSELTCKNDHPLKPFIRLIIHVIGDGVHPVGSHLSNKSQVRKFIPNHHLHIITAWTRDTVEREENCWFPKFWVLTYMGHHLKSNHILSLIKVPCAFTQRTKNACFSSLCHLVLLECLLTYVLTAYWMLLLPLLLSGGWG